MIIQFTLASRSRALLKLVGEFAQGLECEFDVRTTHADVRARLPEDASADLLLHLLSYVALSSVKLGLDVSEPQCQVRFHEPKAEAAVTLAFSVSAVDLGKASDPGAKTSH
jgi:hypothetical protein